MEKPKSFELTVKEDISALSQYYESNDINEVDQFGMSSLHWAALLGKSDSVAFMVQNGAKIDLKDKDGIKPSEWARSQGNKRSSEIIRMRFESEQMGWPILCWIAKKGQHSLVSCFLNEGNVNEVDKDFGRSPAHWAVFACKKYKDKRTLNLILGCKSIYVDLQDTCDGRTPICMATYLDDIDAVRSIIKLKPDLEIKDNDPCYTPVMWSILRENEKIAKILLAYSANVKQVDKNGKTVLQMALESKNQQISELFSYCDKFDDFSKYILDLFKEIRSSKSNKIAQWQHKIQEHCNKHSNLISKETSDYINKYTTFLMMGTPRMCDNIFDQDNQLQPLIIKNSTKPSLESANNEYILTKRMKSSLERLF